jgi:hypothetical protein
VAVLGTIIQVGEVVRGFVNRDLASCTGGVTEFVVCCELPKAFGTKDCVD